MPTSNVTTTNQTSTSNQPGVGTPVHIVINESTKPVNAPVSSITGMNGTYNPFTHVWTDSSGQGHSVQNQPANTVTTFTGGWGGGGRIDAPGVTGIEEESHHLHGGGGGGGTNVIHQDVVGPTQIVTPPLGIEYYAYYNAPKGYQSGTYTSTGQFYPDTGAGANFRPEGNYQKAQLVLNNGTLNLIPEGYYGTSTKEGVQISKAPVIETVVPVPSTGVLGYGSYSQTRVPPIEQVSTAELPKGIYADISFLRQSNNVFYQGAAGVAAGIVEAGAFGKEVVTHPIKTVKSIPGSVKTVFTEGLPEIGEMIRTEPVYTTTYVASQLLLAKGLGKAGQIGLSKTGTLIEKSPAALKTVEAIKASKPFTLVSGYAKDIKNTNIWKNIAYEGDVLELTRMPKISEIAGGEKGFNEFMTIKNTLPKSITEQELASQAAISKEQEILNMLQNQGINIQIERKLNPEIFPEQTRQIQTKIASESSIQKQVMGSTALATETGFQEKFMQLFGERKPEGFVGDIELAIRGIEAEMKSINLQGTGTQRLIKAINEEGDNIVVKIIKKENGKYEFDFSSKGRFINRFTREKLVKKWGELSDEQLILNEISYGEPYKSQILETSLTAKPETSTTLKAKTQLAGAKNIYKETIEIDKILAEEKKFLEEGLNKNLDLEKLKSEFGMSEQQGFTLEEAGRLGTPVKGSTIKKLRNIQEGKTEDISFEGKDIDVKAKNLKQLQKVNEQFIKDFEAAFPGELEKAQQMKIQYKGIQKAEIGEITDYLKGTETKPPVGSFTEIPTGKVLQTSEAVQFDIKELFNKIETDIKETSMVLPQTKGGEINIDLSRFFVEGMDESLLDVAVERNLGLRIKYALTKGEELEFTTLQGSKFKTVKQLFQEYENIDRVQNAMTYEAIEKGAKHVLQSIEEGKYNLDKSIKVKAKNAEAYSAEKSLEFSNQEVVLTKEGDRFVLSKVKKIEGAEPAEAQLTKFAEFYNKETFPELLKGKTEKATLGEGEVSVQSALGSRSSKSLAASTRDIYVGEFGKDIKDLITTRALAVERIEKGISKLDNVYAKNIIQAELNKMISLYEQAEGKIPIESTANLPTRYLRDLIKFEKGEMPKKYTPLTEKEFLENQKIKIALEKDTYTNEQLTEALYKKLNQEVSAGFFKGVSGKAFGKLKEEVGGRKVLTKTEAQKAIDKTLSEIQGDIKNINKQASEGLQKEMKSKDYFKAEKDYYNKLYESYPKEYYAEASYTSYDKYGKAEKVYNPYKAMEQYSKTVYDTLKQPITNGPTYIKTPAYPKTPAKPNVPYTPVTPYTPITPYTPTTPSSIISYYKPYERKASEKKSLGSGYDVLIKVVKTQSFAKVNNLPLTYKRAKDVQAYYLDNSLARTSKIKKSGQAEEDFQFLHVPEGYFDARKYTLREYRIKERTPYAFGEQTIKLSKYLQDTEAEKRQLQYFKKQAQMLTSGNK